MTNSAAPYNPKDILQGPEHTIKIGDRIAQGVLCPILQATFEVTDSLSNTERGAGGFGSTGT
jgi:dUTP pyrophosphatase